MVKIKDLLGRNKSAPPAETADLEGGKALAQIDTFDDDAMAQLKRMRALCKFMDTGIKVPIIGYKFGADAIIGMVPYAGDAWGAMVGMYLISTAMKYHLPKRLVAHMAVNQAVDCCVGVVPFLGDLFDFGYKANYRNMMLIEDHLKQPAKAKRADSCFLFGVFFLVVVCPLLLVACIIGGIVVAIMAAFGAF
ncbi:MAG: hypothetical protein J3K34DRAFT_84700 [Monoraphidium minutum]|nr:MAG: hypothetical protein J3K34DRAFT_84700 [Monoraphidium minutum]